MRVSDFDDVDRLATEGLLTGSKERNWLWLGLIISLLIHFGLCTYFYRTHFASADTVFAPNEQTPTFKVKRVSDSNLEKSSADQIDSAAKPNPDNTDVQLPDEKKSFDKMLHAVQASTALPDDMRHALRDQKGQLGSGRKLRLPDDQLFEYDSDVLQSSAIVQLQKLGTLIQRNPKATFSVEGYTDAFGTYEYNLGLSQRRADSVKRYLVEAMGINPAQIQTHGFGAAKFRASPNGSIEEQSPNRRVEVVVRTSEG